MRTASPSLRASRATLATARVWRTTRTLAVAGFASFSVAACGGSDGGGGGGTGPTPAIALSVASGTASVVQGGAATSVAATIARSGGFTGDVAVTATGTGLTVTATPNSLGSAVTSSAISISAPAATAPGTYPVTVTATGTGVTTRTATINVTVTGPGGGGGGGTPTNIPLTFSASRAPTWVAYQSGTGAWTRATGTGTAYTAAITDRGAIAFVVPNGTGFETHVYYGTTAELTTIGTGLASATEVGTKALTGTVANIGTTANDDATILFAGSGNRVIGSQALSYTLTNVLDGPRDLLAVQKGPGTPTRQVLKYILRRGLNPANASAIPVLDFGAAEALAPAAANITIAGLGAGEAALVRTSFITDKGFLGSLPFDFTDPQATATQRYYGLRAPLQAGDLQVGSATTTANPSREAVAFFTDIVDRTLTLGPAMGAATLNAPTTAPYVRPRATTALQAEYGAGAVARFTQSPTTSPRIALVVATPASTALAAGTWTLDLPDFTAAGGYDANWAPKTGTAVTSSLTVYGDRLLLPNRRQVLPGDTPTAGMTLKTATRSVDFTP